MKVSECAAVHRCQGDSMDCHESPDQERQYWPGGSHIDFKTPEGYVLEHGFFQVINHCTTSSMASEHSRPSCHEYELSRLDPHGFAGSPLRQSSQHMEDESTVQGVLRELVAAVRLIELICVDSAPWHKVADRVRDLKPESWTALVVAATSPFVYSLPRGLFVVSSGMVERLLYDENLLAAVLSFEISVMLEGTDQHCPGDKPLLKELGTWKRQDLEWSAEVEACVDDRALFLMDAAGYNCNWAKHAWQLLRGCWRETPGPHSIPRWRRVALRAAALMCSRQPYARETDMNNAPEAVWDCLQSDWAELDAEWAALQLQLAVPNRTLPSADPPSAAAISTCVDSLGSCKELFP